MCYWYYQLGHQVAFVKQKEANDLAIIDKHPDLSFNTLYLVIPIKEHQHSMAITLTKQLFDTIESEILKGIYKINARFPSERIISERYGVSRITTRDALSRLCQMGLLKKIPQSGYYVTDYLSEASMDVLIRIMQSKDSIDKDILFSLLEFRRANEVYAAGKTASNITDNGIRELELHTAKAQKNIGNLSLLCDSDYEIHRVVIYHSGNRILPLLFNSFRSMYRYYTEFFYRMPGAAAHVMPLYHKLSAACRSHDSDYAAHVMDTILCYAENRVKDGLSYLENDTCVDLAAFRQGSS